jgi:hypothetical protein
MTVLGIDSETQDFVRLGPEARARGVYVIGSTGTGKTTLLQSIAYQDMKAGHGVGVLDPHGDMIDWLLERVPPERVEDVILFDPSDIEYPFGLNILECDRDDPQQVNWTVSTVFETLHRLFYYSWGPRLEHVLGHTLWTAMEIPDSTIVEVLLLLTDEEYRQEKTKDLQQPMLKAFWRDLPRGFRQRHDMISSTINKLTPFLLNPQMRNIVGQSESTLDLREVMDEHKILLVNLAKGDLGERNSSLLGSVLVNMFLIAALSRRDMSYEERLKVPFHLIVDEYQNFASESFSVLQSEARKYAIDLIVAHQFRDQLSEENRGSALNVGNFVSFRTTGVDGVELARQFDNTPPPPDPIWEPIRMPSEQWQGYYERGAVDEKVPGPQRLYSDVVMQTANDLANLPPFQAQVKTIEKDEQDGQLKLEEYILKTMDPGNPKFKEKYYGLPNGDLPEQIKKQSQALARPWDVVHREIIERIGGDLKVREVKPGQWRKDK